MLLRQYEAYTYCLIHGQFGLWPSYMRLRCCGFWLFLLFEAWNYLGNLSKKHVLTRFLGYSHLDL